MPGLVTDPALASLICLPGLNMVLPPCCAFAQPSLGCSSSQLPSSGLLCSACWGAARLHANRHWARIKRAWHVAFPSTGLKNQTSSLSYRKNYCIFIKNLAGSCHLNRVHHLGKGLFARISLNIIFNSSTMKSFLHHLDAISFWVQKSQSHFSEGFVGGGWFCWAKVVFLLNLHLK